MDIRCRFGLHEWKVYYSFHRLSIHNIKYTEFHVRCPGCGKMKIIKWGGW